MNGPYNSEIAIQVSAISCPSFQLWVAYAPCGSQHMDAVQVTLVQIDVIKRLTESYPQHLQLVRTADGEEQSWLAFIPGLSCRI